MTPDHEERAWWAFCLPSGASVHVPAITERAARDVLRHVCYRKAPVDAWECVGSRWASREMVAGRKAELFPGVFAIEIYPPEDQVVDAANMRHLFVCPGGFVDGLTIAGEWA